MTILEKQNILVHENAVNVSTLVQDEERRHLKSMTNCVYLERVTE